ncbi:unnamed protein product [Acanthoscelides obtectus]|uniref:Uncharacterized protein n=1 Tax=Acanthoscelides obtectus TaxID=200917 RepID=A0A9P0LKH4_ACAOB|nr:unnamed protein product [Acanthoscelides obtectus]CAK1624511.1 hypothetical protein AOBTE_LOCUS2581 [Acanthoscelides obtectus]
MGHLFLPEETNNPAVIILGLGNYPDSCIDGNRAFEFDAQRNKLVIYASPSRSIAKNDRGNTCQEDEQERAKKEPLKKKI